MNKNKLLKNFWFFKYKKTFRSLSCIPNFNQNYNEPKNKIKKLNSQNLNSKKKSIKGDINEIYSIKYFSKQKCPKNKKNFYIKVSNIIDT